VVERVLVLLLLLLLLVILLLVLLLLLRASNKGLPVPMKFQPPMLLL